MSGFLGDRRTYERAALDREHLLDDPLEQARVWLKEAVEIAVPEASAMALATVSTDGKPSNRMVLIRAIDHGFVFYTNYLSRKAQDLDATGVASGVLWWPELERQLRVEGSIERTSAKDSDEYFATRPFESQLASMVSPQSRRIESRNVLESEIERLRGSAGPLRRPEHWGGYRILPERFEFWQGRPARLHDRFEYARDDGVWKVHQLAP